MFQWECLQNLGLPTTFMSTKIYSVSVTGIDLKCLLLAKKGCRRDKFVIRSVTDILQTKSRFVKCVL